jgi:hypothetical protein
MQNVPKTQKLEPTRLVSGPHSTTVAPPTPEARRVVGQVLANALARGAKK